MEVGVIYELSRVKNQEPRTMTNPIQKDFLFKMNFCLDSWFLDLGSLKTKRHI